MMSLPGGGQHTQACKVTLYPIHREKNVLNSKGVGNVLSILKIALEAVGDRVSASTQDGIAGTRLTYCLKQ